VAFEDANPDLGGKLEAACAALVNSRAVLAPLADIKTMSDLVRFMVANGAFGPTGPN